MVFKYKIIKLSLWSSMFERLDKTISSTHYTFNILSEVFIRMNINQYRPSNETFKLN